MAISDRLAHRSLADRRGESLFFDGNRGQSDRDHRTPDLLTRANLSDSSGALASRFVVLKTENSFYGNEDPQLTDKLLEELPGILNWALDGLDRLRQRGHFVQPESSAHVIEELEELSSPISVFVAECCDVDPNHEVPIQEL